jgi:hypothetical protein
MEQVFETIETEHVVELDLEDLAQVGGGTSFDDANSGGAG